MNANAKKWLAALRSGQYEQGQGQLRTGNKFCCLGVACDIYGKENGVEWDGGWLLGGYTNLPNEVKDWLGLTGYEGDIDDGPSLAKLNDSGSTFAQIADIIESEPEGLFKEQS